MKRLLFFAALILVTLTSCVSELDKTMVERDRGRIQKFYATMEGNEPDTKVYADENMKVLWNADDRLTVFNQSTYNSQFRFAGDDGDNAGDFDEIPASGLISGNSLSNIYAVYPYAKANKINNAGTTITLTLPAEQAYKEHSFGIGANTMVAATNNNFLAFKNVGGYLSLRLYGDDVSVSRITLQGRNHEKIAGKATVSVGVGALPTVTMASDATETISIVCDPPVQLGTSSSNYTDFWFVIPPVTFTKGFSVTVTDALGGTFSVSTSSSFKISRSTVEWMAPLKVVPNYDNVNVVFADANFKAYCVEKFDTDHNGEISIAETQEIKTIDVCTDNIASLQGIENFRNLQTLICSGSNVGCGQLTSLDVSKNTELVGLVCSYNQLTNIDVSKNTALDGLRCDYNQLTSLDVSKNTKLSLLNCNYNLLNSIDLNNNLGLGKIYCNNNHLTALDVSKNTKLGRLTCKNNPSLSRIWCSTEQIKAGMNLYYDTAVATVEQVVYIPDANFKMYCLKHFDSDEDGRLTTTEAAAIMAIDVRTDNIQTLQGIEYMTNLKSLVCTGSDYGMHSGSLKTLPISSNTALEYIECSGNKISSLDLSSNVNLIHLSCGYNLLTAIDVSNNTALKALRFGCNQLTTLDVSNNPQLLTLDCIENQLTSLNLDNNPNIDRLDIDGNQITGFIVGDHPSLTYFSCANCGFASLDVSQNTVLRELNCGNNPLTTIDVSSNAALTSLSCYSNQLTSLDISHNPSLTFLNCSSNQLTSINVSTHTALRQLWCWSNLLTSLDVSNNAALVELNCHQNPNLTEIWLKKNQSFNQFNYDTTVATIKYKD